MQRYFVSKSNWSNDEKVTITGNDVHHITRVMRMDVGDKLICNHPDGRAATCIIDQLVNDSIIVSPIEWRNEVVELPINVTIAQGLPKGDKMDLILQKGTELGAFAFIPFQAERSVVKWDQKKIAKKLERFNKITKEASEQSHRTHIPPVESIYSFKQLLDCSEKYDVKLFAYEEEARSDSFRRLSDVLNEIEPTQRILACIGPEGGYTIDEVDALKLAGFHSVRLGPRILRTETAPLYLLSSISYHFEELR
ncbi:16S rRNA (uracil(1498)-N(3))-methyltransferase [Aquibacillus halophilus]|uniref:Ribosomal RNA small subunit methyltransferase E n=1 Tax=Aquibacillus halophilus TaxID=930132 RepID=A0A6A8DEX2_9BACI|nr:16S rRNA (uracil(1498)-N(3))-methyltransferase [Aquibacillus halophilus]